MSKVWLWKEEEEEKEGEKDTSAFVSQTCFLGFSFIKGLKAPALAFKMNIFATLAVAFLFAERSTEKLEGLVR